MDSKADDRTQGEDLGVRWIWGIRMQRPDPLEWTDREHKRRDLRDKCVNFSFEHIEFELFMGYLSGLIEEKRGENRQRQRPVGSTWSCDLGSGRMRGVRRDVNSPLGEISMFKARWREGATETSFWNWLLRLLSTLNKVKPYLSFRVFHSLSVHI